MKRKAPGLGPAIVSIISIRFDSHATETFDTMRPNFRIWFKSFMSIERV